MQWDDDVLEKDYVFISQWHRETRDDTRQDVEELGGTIELVVLVDEGEEALVDSLSNHLSSWYEFGVQLVKNVLQVVPLYGLLRVEELEELLDELRGDIDLERSHFNGLIDYKLQEELVNSLEVWPSWIDLILLLDSCLRELKVLFLEVGKWSEDIFLNHSHNIIKMWDD